MNIDHGYCEQLNVEREGDLQKMKKVKTWSDDVEFQKEKKRLGIFIKGIAWKYNQGSGWQLSWGLP